MLVGQNVPAGISPEQRAEIIERRLNKLHTLVESNETVKESVDSAVSIARQIAISEAIKRNEEFQAAFAEFLQHMDD